MIGKLIEVKAIIIKKLCILQHIYIEIKNKILLD